MTMFDTFIDEKTANKAFMYGVHFDAKLVHVFINSSRDRLLWIVFVFNWYIF